jgi:hypothetical protein
VGIGMLYSNGYDADTDAAIFACLGAAFAIDIYSIVNAYKTAKKVNKARGYNLGKKAYFNISPAVMQDKSFALGKMQTKTNLGLSFRVTF